MIEQDGLRVLKARFARARVPLRIANAPFVRGVHNEAIVQMDIRNRPQRGRRREEFVIWPGAAERLEVLGTDAVHQQVVLLVKEREIAFEERMEVQKRTVTRRRRTGGGIRRFLIGMDERHLFIAPLSTRAGSVGEAHAQLQPPAVVEARARGAHVVRQGEWFFLPADDELQARIEAHVRHMGIERHAGIGMQRVSNTPRSWGRTGRVHVVDERVVLRLPVEGDRSRRFEFLECVRGHVRHRDHKVRVLESWHRVVPNTEAALQSGRFVLTRWVD